MLGDLAVPDAEEADRPPLGRQVAGGDAHERTRVRALAVYEGGDDVVLTHHVHDGELHVGERGAEHAEDRLDAVEATGHAWRRAVVDVAGIEQLLDHVEMTLVDDLVDHALVGSLACYGLGAHSFPPCPSPPSGP